MRSSRRAAQYGWDRKQEASRGEHACSRTLASMGACERFAQFRKRGALAPKLHGNAQELR